MNIFEILSAGNRILKEEHISAVLGWMLDPYHDHGLGMELLKRICHASFGHDAEISKVLSAGEFSGLVMRDRGRLPIHTEMEVTVNTGPREEIDAVSGNERSIDILVKIKEKIVLAIENKTSPGSIQETQLKEEVDGFDATFNKDKDHKLYFLFLTPAGVGQTADKAMKLIDRAKCAAEPVHILWKSEGKDGQNSRPSISQLLNEILRDEAIGNTSPLSSETKFLMKSFIRFIENDFSYIQGKLQRDGKYFIDSFNGIDEGQAMFNKPELRNSGPLYVGFMGGLEAFEASLKEAVNNVDRQIQLKNRRFKTANDTSLNGKSKANWFLIQDFLDLVDKYPFTKFPS